MKKTFLPAEGADSWKCLLGEHQHEWTIGHPLRTLANCWKDTEGFPHEIRAGFQKSPGLEGVQPLLIFPGWENSLLRGVSDLSHDLWLLGKNGSTNVSISVMGLTESSLLRTVAELHGTHSIGTGYPLFYLKEALGLSDVPEDICYNFLHQAATAVLEAEHMNAQSAVVLVQAFGDCATGFRHFARFASLFDVHATKDHVLPGATHSRVPLYVGWITGEERYLHE